MATESKSKKTDTTAEARKVIGDAIIKGLITPFAGGIRILQYYNQTDGGYWQNDGDGHTQGSGDYHQSAP